MLEGVALVVIDAVTDGVCVMVEVALRLTLGVCDGVGVPLELMVVVGVLLVLTVGVSVALRLTVEVNDVLGVCVRVLDGDGSGAIVGAGV